MPRALSNALKNKILELPLTSGVYLFQDEHKTPIYIGKAKCLKKRVIDHFRHWGESFSKESKLLAMVRFIEFVPTADEADALLLEASLVKQHQPKYNQLLKDDKSYPFLKITSEAFPRLLVVRQRKADGAKYWGPFTNGRLLRRAVKSLRKQFPMRTCNKMPKKVCLMFHVGQCHGPCDGSQTPASYLETVKNLQNFLEGRKDSMVRVLARRMREYSAAKEYEKAKDALDTMRALQAVPDARKTKDHTAALEALQTALHLPSLPARIECFDISNFSGDQAVGSMVVFEDGQPKKSDYRRFKIKTVRGIDDYQMMREVLARRLDRVSNAGQNGSWRLPDLMVIDGGKGHLEAVCSVLRTKGFEQQPIISIAKQHEHLFKPGESKPYVLPLNAPALEVIRRLRDEAHRFAISYYRKLHRGKIYH